MFNKETAYAIRALVYIQQENNRHQRPGIDQLATSIEVPRSYIAKILQRMVRLGFIKSVKGKGGGFYFEADGPELPLKEVILSIQGNQLLTGCCLGLTVCSEKKPCPLHAYYVSIRETINQLVQSETIQSLAKKNNYGIENLSD
jgi:Rrf2 family protein